MKRFEKFGEYMFDLLFAPLKKGKRVTNQFYIFFKVVGREFDDVKAAFFRLRDESNVVSASPIMLPIHGQDRDMPRLIGEEVEAYRIRLSMKGIISEWGGTRQGLSYVLTALGFKGAFIMPAYSRDTERWAEFYVVIPMNADDMYPIGPAVLKKEIRRIKEGSAKDNYLVIINTCCSVKEQFVSPRITLRTIVNWYNGYVLNGEWNLDGTVFLDSRTILTTRIIFRSQIENQIEYPEKFLGDRLSVKYHYWVLDGYYSLNGERMLDAKIYEEDLE